MTQAEAECLVKEALSCPFCGERLVVEVDPHFPDRYWCLRHPGSDGACLLTYRILVNTTETNLWNTRAIVEIPTILPADNL